MLLFSHPTVVLGEGYQLAIGVLTGTHVYLLKTVIYVRRTISNDRRVVGLGSSQLGLKDGIPSLSPSWLLPKPTTRRSFEIVLKLALVATSTRERGELRGLGGGGGGGRVLDKDEGFKSPCGGGWTEVVCWGG